MNQLSNNRTIINVIGIPAITYLLWQGGILFALFVLVVMIIGINEFYRLTTTKDQSPIKIFGYIFTFILAGYYYMLPDGLVGEPLSYLLSILMVILFLMEMRRNIKHSTKNIAITILGVMYVPLLLGSLIALRNLDSTHNTNFTICMILSIWMCDSAAYVFGMKWGKKKILPRVSPNKSWVGCIAGLLSAIVFFFTLSYQGFLPDLSNLDIVALSIMTGFFGQAGDFAESLIKRDLGVKDSGTILLGHGGVLDRFDSIIFSSPLTYAYLTFIYFPRVS
jgi:phosphatidate cytidylyltransferase